MNTATIKFVCTECGANDRIYALAYVDWNTATQDWDFGELWDDNLRCACGGEEILKEQAA